MLSPDVPEFIPRGYQTLESTSTLTIKPQESTPQPQQTGPQTDPKHINTWRKPREASGDPFTNRHESGTETPPKNESSTPRQTLLESSTPRQTLPESSTPRQTLLESSTPRQTLLESSTPRQTLPESSTLRQTLPEPQTSEEGKATPRTVTEDLELQMRNKFVTPRPPYSYTRILQSKKTTKSVSEAKSSRPQDFSFSTEGHWPTLGESLPLHKPPDRHTEPSGTEKSSTNPWVKRSSQASPVKSPVKSPIRDTPEQIVDASTRSRTMETSSSTQLSTTNQEQDGGVAEWRRDNSVRAKNKHTSSYTKRQVKSSANSWQERRSAEPRLTEGNAGNSEGRIRTKPASLTPPTKTGTSLNSDNKGLDSKRHPPQDKSDKLDKEQSNHEDYAAAAITPATDSLGAHSREEAAPLTTQEDPDLFQWRVMGEKKKKVKIKPEEEVKDHPQLPVSGRNRRKHFRVLPEKTSKNHREKESQENVSKTLRSYSLDLSWRKEAAHSPSPEGTRGAGARVSAAPRAGTRVSAAPRAGQKEVKKTRPTRVMSLANCSNARKETKAHSKMGANTPAPPPAAAAAAAAAAKPEDEEAQQRKLAAKRLTKEEKKKLKEMKAREALVLLSKDTKVSVITTNFLAKTQALRQAPAHPFSQAKTGAQNMKFTFEEYPTLQRNSAPSRPSDKDTPHPSASGRPAHRDTPHPSASGRPAHQDTPHPSPSGRPAHQDTPHPSPSGRPAHRDAQQSPPPPPHLPSDTEAPKTSSSLPGVTFDPQKRHKLIKTNKHPLSTKGRLQADNLLSNLHPAKASGGGGGGASGGGGGGGAAEECATITYRTALLSAKDMAPDPPHTKLYTDGPGPAPAKLYTDSPAPAPAKLYNDSPANTMLQKKKVKTSDPIELDLFALAAKSAKSKKKATPADAEESRDKVREDEDENALEAGKPGAGAALTKGAVVVVKRGKIRSKKKRRLSHVKRCKIEKRQREILAVQLLLHQAKVTQQQLQAASPATCDTAKDSTEAQGTSVHIYTTEPLKTATKTEADEEEDKGRPEGEEEKVKPEDNSKEEALDYDDCKVYERCSGVLHTSLNAANSQAKNSPAQDAAKLVWTNTGTRPGGEDEMTLPEMSSKSVTDENTEEGEGKASHPHSTEGELKSSPPPARQTLHTDDPQIAKKATQLKERLRLEKINPKGPREYCHQMVTPEVDAAAREFITTIITFQKRHFQRDPLKARMRKRFVCGLKETTKLMGRMSCVIMAPNIQQCEGPGSLDDAVEKLLNQAEKLKVPVVFALSTVMMKKLCHKHSRKVSCFGIISYQGAQDSFHRLMQLMPEAQQQYQQLVASGQCTLPKEGEGEETEDEGERESAKDVNAEVLAHTSALLMAP